ncbi:MFS transporter [Francisella sp. LA112445]|uniref:MFS transporter n=1 Tax=Francisella sp. LA112445 TaxID=1395624 RepID=UPI001788C46F|nr:MFS transporter [Francisella sp. LA112445]QIW10800.1 MHS family MFS transporter [Francisella sp. LA112445]
MSFKKSFIKTVKVSFGNMIEWYDYSLYGYFAIIISHQFFPSQSSWLSLLLTFGTFAAGYIARPLGSIFFGYLGDRKGRHFAMNIAILFMAIPTIIMAFIPTYASVGVLAPIILVVIRIFQGVSAGGQFGNLMAIASEDSQLRYTGFNVSVAFSTSILGFILASAVSSLAVNIFPADWGNLVWRIPFALGAILLIAFLFFREKDEKESFLSESRSPVIQLTKTYRRHLISVTTIATVALMIYYIDITYMTTYMVDILGMHLSVALTVNTIAIFFMFLSTPFFGFISDKIGRKEVLLFSFIVSLILSPILIYLLDAGRLEFSTFILIILAIMTGMIQGAANPCYTEVFPSNVRASGASIVYGLGASISGFAPLLATFITGVMSPVLGVSLLMFILCGIGVLMTFVMPVKQMGRRRLNDLEQVIYSKEKVVKYSV